MLLRRGWPERRCAPQGASERGPIDCGLDYALGGYVPRAGVAQRESPNRVA